MFGETTALNRTRVWFHSIRTEAIEIRLHNNLINKDSGFQLSSDCINQDTTTQAATFRRRSGIVSVRPMRAQHRLVTCRHLQSRKLSRGRTAYIMKATYYIWLETLDDFISRLHRESPRSLKCVDLEKVFSQRKIIQQAHI